MSSKFRPARQSGSRRSSIMMTLFLVPVIFVFFICGAYVGSQFANNGDSVALLPSKIGLEITKGLPGTNNILRRWTAGNMQYLRGAAEEMRDVARMAESLVGLAPPAPLTHILTTGNIEPVAESGSVIDGVLEKEIQELKGLSRPIMPNSMYNHPPEHQQIFTDSIVTVGHIVSGTQQKDILENSLHATGRSYMVAPNTLDNENLLVGAWVFLDNSSKNDKDMRIIFTNKKAGCENQKEQYGLAMYVNAWGTNNHLLYVEYGGLNSGCHKLDSNEVQLHPEKWYHVAVYLSGSKAFLYIDGTVVSSSNSNSDSESNNGNNNGNNIGNGNGNGNYDNSGIEGHQVQLNRPIKVGQYDNGQYPFYGNISHLAFIHCDKSWKISTIGKVVESLMDVSIIMDIKGLYAFYPLIDAISEVSSSIAVEIKHSLNGVYIFPLVGKSHKGIDIDLIWGVDDRLITIEMKEESNKLGIIRKEIIKNGMKHAWKGYKTYAWGQDEVEPISKRGSDPWGGMGVTLIDSLDTLWTMGLFDEFQEARDWVANELTFFKATTVSMFETTIRELAGLLSAFDLSDDKIFLDKATQLADLLMPAFETESGIPKGQVDLRSHSAVGDNNAILSELGTLQIEFRYLAEKTKIINYEKKVMKPLQILQKINPDNGLYPIKINIHDGSFADTYITLGALGDSFYEYLLKVWIQGNKKETWLRNMYDNAINGIIDILLKASTPSGLAFLSDWTGSATKRKMDHLVCFMPGILTLGAHTDPQGKDSLRAKRDLALAKALMFTCYQMYQTQITKISPEFVEFPENSDNVDMVVTTAPFYILRPETAESLFVMHQLTGDPIYREWSWSIWESINKYCRTDIAYGALQDVTNINSGIDDRMESFFLAETLKYLYLIQDPDNTIDLDKYVLNTEAHPLRIFDDSHIPVPSS